MTVVMVMNVGVWCRDCGAESIGQGMLCRECLARNGNGGMLVHEVEVWGKVQDPDAKAMGGLYSPIAHSPIGINPY